MPLMPRDGFGREIDYLRISLTDHCNLRCVYCMPTTGLSFQPSEALLTADGRFHLCLLNDDELDVRGTIRGGGDVAAVADVLLRAVAHKPTGHHLALGRTTADRQMFQIGG